MSDLFPNNQYDADIINQPEIEYRTAKYPFRMRHHYIDSIDLPQEQTKQAYSDFINRYQKKYRIVKGQI